MSKLGKIVNLEERFIITRWLYSSSDPEALSDAEYNNLERYIKSNNLLPEYTNRTWSEDPCPLALLNKYNMKDKIMKIIMSIEKTESIPSITTIVALQAKYGNMTNPISLSYKMDGFNFRIRFHNKYFLFGETRGRSSDSLLFDYLTELFGDKVITEMGIVDIVGEMTLSDENFRILKTIFPERNLKSKRAAVRTALSTKETIKLLTFTAFEILNVDYDFSYKIFLLEEWGFNTPSFTIVRTYEELVTTVKYMSDQKDVNGQPTDGVVARDLTSGEMWAIRLYGWEESIYKSYVLNYDEGFASQGRSMKVNIKPVRLESSTQRKVSLTNLNRVIKFKLVPGAPIAFILRSAANAVIDPDTTFLLQQQYKDNFDQYIDEIDEEENAKQKFYE